MTVRRPLTWMALIAGTLTLFGFSHMLPVQGQSADIDREVATATFAGGCFWCMEHPFDELEGVVSTTSGYIGGHVANPTYKRVSWGGTGHYEALQVEYDPKVVSYETLLDTFWVNVDPTDDGGQFCDRGDQYRTGIFAHDTEQRQLAEMSKQGLVASNVLSAPIVTEVIDATEFYPAEDYHQDYYLKNPVRYKVYRYGCGRDRRLAQLWGEDRVALQLDEAEK